MKVLFTTHDHLGDSVISTAAVRDLKRQYPEIRINVDMKGMEFWENNPYIDPKVNKFNADKIVKLQYISSQRHADIGTLIDGWIKGINRELSVNVKKSKNAVDIYLKEEEKVNMFGGEYWLINAGFQECAQTKAWPFEKYQEVVNRSGKRFIQVGSTSDYHKKLDNVINMLDCDLRTLCKLVYGCTGVVTPPSMLGHLASMQTPKKAYRRGIIICGNREPSDKLFGYPNFKYLKSNRCSGDIGCMRFDTYGNYHRCEQVEIVNGQYIAGCMNDISAMDVVRAMT